MSNNPVTGELLSFQEYSPVHNSHGREGSARLEVEAVHASGPMRNDSMSDLRNDLQGSKFVPQDDEAPPSVEKNHNFWTIEYYQKYFDVDTDDVVQRILCSIVPQRGGIGYFDQTIRGKPDLYGPFWIATTLIFTIAVSGNIADYLQHVNIAYQWHYDFHLVSIAATCIFLYISMVPLGLWGALKWTLNEDAAQIAVEEDVPATPSMISLFCVYGYSLSVYIPVSILWTIQVSWLQWLLLITAALLSGLVLVYLLLPALKRSKQSIVLIACILSFHFLLAAGFMLYFFRAPKVDVIIPSTVKPSA